MVDDLAASTHAIGELMLEVAPAYLPDTDAADVRAPLCEAIGEPLEYGLAARRYAPVRRPPRPARHRPVTAAARLAVRWFWWLVVVVAVVLLVVLVVVG